MATLQKIRTKAGLLVAIVIGVSLAAFILGDLIKGGSSVFQKNRLEVGVIDGESIQYPDFQKQVEELGEIFKQNYQTNQLDDNAWTQVREQAWQSTINKIVMGDVYEDLGIEISSDELFDMLQGANPHQIVQQIFRNPETGQFDRASVVRFLKNLETGVAQDQRVYWLNLEKQIVDERTQSKYANMVGKGLYVTSEQAQASATAGSKTVNFDYISLPHSTVKNDEVTVTEKDLKAYYNEHQNDYKQEQSRRVEYITYAVTPSEADYKDAEEWIEDIKSDFSKAQDNVQFVNSNSDVNFENVWNKKEDLPENIAAWVFDENAQVNDVFGPYAEGASFTLAKLHKSEMMPDSVEARHILLQVTTQAELIAAQALADSLKTMIDKGADFAKLARENSSDQGSAINGGDLGWFKRNQMVKPFEEVAFNNSTDSVTIVATQFGLHLIQTTKRGKLTPQVQVAYLTRNVVPSTKTYQNTYALASKFAGENTTKEEFDAAVATEKLTKRVANVGENERQIVGLENARQLIRAAYQAEVNDILQTTQESPIFELGDNFVIAVLTQASEEGIASFDEVKARVELAVVKEKKAELLVEKAKEALAGNSDLSAVATALNTDVQTANNITFNSFSIPGIGLEPSVIGTVSNLGVDKISAPIAGNNGVFVVMVTSENEAPGVNVASEKMRLAQTNSYRVASQVFTTHRNSVEIDDQRSKFY
ncbi:SurA N-terminal domain-containing protein [uncultured Draconibacterium sp.]|uniref:SurA N-terminal domain-containing protein n=1 Tax=uncultured Draconibacterium sp. TaxID=1573823 RepID=UPI00321749AC